MYVMVSYVNLRTRQPFFQANRYLDTFIKLIIKLLLGFHLINRMHDARIHGKTNFQLYQYQYLKFIKCLDCIFIFMHNSFH